MTSNSESKADKWWEGVSEATELRQHANRWTLAGDSATAAVLNKISQQLMLRTEELSSKLNILVQNVGDLATEVANTNNSFTMLSHTQFIENRTYMDDERAPLTETLPDATTPHPDPPSTIYRRALLDGLDIFSACYQAHQLADSDQEEGDTPDSPTSIYTLRNPYAGRSLPHIIMSREFMVDPLVGLRPSSFDDNEEEEKEREEVAAPVVEEDGTSASDEDIGDANIFSKKFQATSSRIVEDDSDSDWSDSLDIEKLKRQRNELLQQQSASSILPNGASAFTHPPPDDTTSTFSESQVVRPQPAGHNSHPGVGRRSNTGPVHYSDSDEEFFKPVAAPGHNTNLFGDSRQPASVTASLQQRLGQHRTAPSSSDSDEEGLFSSGAGRRRPPPLPGGSKHPSSSASSPATSLVPASDDASTVGRSTNVENVRAFPDVNPIASRAGRGALRLSTHALPEPHVPGARGLFSSDTEEDDLFGANPPPLNKLSSDVRVSLGSSSVSPASIAGDTRAAKQQPRIGGDLFGSDEDEREDPTDTDVTVPVQAAVKEIIPVTASGRRVPIGGVKIFSAAITAAIRKPSSDPSWDEEGPPSASATAPYLQQQRALEQQHRIVQQQQQQKQQQRQKQQHQLPPQIGAPKPAPNSELPPFTSDAVTPSEGASSFRGAGTGGLGLFDDDDDDDGLFVSAPTPSAHRQQQGGSSNLSGPVAGDGSSVGASTGLTTPAPPTARRPTESVPTAVVLQSTPPPAPAAAPVPVAGGIFSSDDDDLFSSNSLISSANKKPSVDSVVGPSAKILEKPVIAAKSNVNEERTNILPSSVAEPVVSKAVSLFEDSDDELFSPRGNAPVSSIKIASEPVPTVVSKTITSVPSEQSKGEASPSGDDTPVKITKVPEVPVPKTLSKTPFASVGNNSSAQLIVARPQSGGLFSSGSDEDLFMASTFPEPRPSMSMISASQGPAKATESPAQALPFTPKPVAMDQQQTSEPIVFADQVPSRPSRPAKPQTLEPSLDVTTRPSFHTPIDKASSTRISSGEAADVGIPSTPVIPILISADQPCVKADADESGSGKPSEFIDSSSDEDLLSPSPLALESVGAAAIGSPAFFASDSSEDSFPSLANAIGYQRKGSAGSSAAVGGGLHASQTNKTLPLNRKRANTKKVKFPHDAKQTVPAVSTKPDPKESKESAVQDSSRSQSSLAALKNTPTSDSKASVLSRQADSDSDDLFADMPSVTGRKSDWISTSEKVSHGKSSGLFLSDDDDIFAASSSSSAVEKPLISKPLPTSDQTPLLTVHHQRPVVPLPETNDVEKKSSPTAERDVMEDDIFKYISGEDMFDIGAKPLSSSSVTQPSSAAGEESARPKSEPFPPSAGKDHPNDVGHDALTTSVVDGNVHSSKNVSETPPPRATSGESGQSPLKKKPPVGGVALFGGSELLAKVGKRRQAVDSDKQPIKSQEGEAKTTLPKDSGGAEVTINALRSDKPLPGMKPQRGMKPPVGFREKIPAPVKVVPAEAKFSTRAEGSVDSSDHDESPIISPRKKPVGGVSMFGGSGGAELFAKLKKRQDRLSGPNSDSEGTANTSADSTPSEEHKPFVPSPSTPNTSLSTDLPRRPVIKNAPVSPVKKFLDTHGLSKGPSPASPPVVAKEEATGFETPTAVPVLNSLSKSRPKVGGQRRLPTRLSTKRRGPREDTAAASASDLDDGPSSPLASPLDARCDGGKIPLQSHQSKSDDDLGVIDRIAPSSSKNFLDSRQPEALPSQLSGLLSDALESSIVKRSSSSQSNLLEKQEGFDNLDSGLGSLKSETSSPKTYEKEEEKSSKGSMIEEPMLVSKVTGSDHTRTTSGLFSSSEDDSLFENTNSKTGLQTRSKSRSQKPDIEKCVSASSSAANVAGPSDLNRSATRSFDPPSLAFRSNGIQSYPGPLSNNPHKPLAATSTMILPASELFQKESDSDSDGIFGSSISKVRADNGDKPSPRPVGGVAPVLVANPASSTHKDSVYNQAPRVPVTAARATLPLKSTPYLFADVDDEDDLFGGGSSGGPAPVEQARPVVPSTPTVDAPSTSSASPPQITPNDAGALQDPLSALLK